MVSHDAINDIIQTPKKELHDGEFVNYGPWSFYNFGKM